LLAIPDEANNRNSWELTVPNGLGYILEFRKNLSVPVPGLNEWQRQDRPKMVGLIYYSFRVMIAIGFFLAAVMLWNVFEWYRGNLAPDKISTQKWLMRLWMFSAPLGYIAIEAGWVVRCVGRQPWVLYDRIRTADGVSPVPATNVLTSLIFFMVIYSILLVTTLYFASRIIGAGPKLNLPLPGDDGQFILNTEPAESVPDRRPVEAQQ
jgi:cytochrome bd ubiquinol oxidase subunit I